MKRKTWKEYLKYFNYFIDWYYGAYVAKPHSAAAEKQHPCQGFLQALYLYSSGLQNAALWSSAHAYLFVLKSMCQNITVANTQIISSSVFLMVLKIEIKNCKVWSSPVAGAKIEPSLDTILKLFYMLQGHAKCSFAVCFISSGIGGVLFIAEVRFFSPLMKADISNEIHVSDLWETPSLCMGRMLQFKITMKSWENLKLLLSPAGKLGKI